MKVLTQQQAIEAIKHRHGDADNVIVKAVAMDVTTDEADEYKVTATISCDTVDRDGQVLLPSGMISKEFEKSGTIFWLHDYGIPVAKPVGKLRRTEKSVIASCEFPRRPDGYEGEFFPDYVRALVKQGVVKGVSVGLIPIEWRPPTPPDLARFGPCREVISRWELLEWSFAPVPCNPDALVMPKDLAISAVTKGIIVAEVMKQLFGVEVPEGTVQEAADPTVYITREIAPDSIEVKQIIHQVEEQAPTIKVVHRTIPDLTPAQPSVATRIKQMVRNAMAKRRGRVFQEEE